METRRPDFLGLVAALVVALGLIAGGFLAGGRYEMTTQSGAVVRLDRWTGQTVGCLAACAQLIPAGDPLR